jgi:hypothetical protein
MLSSVEAAAAAPPAAAALALGAALAPADRARLGALLGDAAAAAAGASGSAACLSTLARSLHAVVFGGGCGSQRKLEVLASDVATALALASKFRSNASRFSPSSLSSSSSSGELISRVGARVVSALAAGVESGASRALARERRRKNKKGGKFSSSSSSLSSSSSSSSSDISELLWSAPARPTAHSLGLAAGSAEAFCETMR